MELGALHAYIISHAFGGIDSGGERQELGNYRDISKFERSLLAIVLSANSEDTMPERSKNKSLSPGHISIPLPPILSFDRKFTPRPQP